MNLHATIYMSFLRGIYPPPSCKPAATSPAHASDMLAPLLAASFWSGAVTPIPVARPRMSGRMIPSTSSTSVRHLFDAPNCQRLIRASPRSSDTRVDPRAFK